MPRSPKNACPALAAGNSVLVKPASDTPLSALKLTEILLEAGLPPEGIQCVTGPGGEVGDTIVADRRVRKVDLDAVVREYTHLRDELWGAIWCDLHGTVHSSDVYYLNRALAGTLDRIIEETVRTYLGS